jgi:ABC-type nickel/cobalt efflux system permease component RcnA
MISAITHTFSIVFLSFTASLAIQSMAPERLTHWIELMAGFLITLIGAKILYRHFFPRILTIGKLSQLNNPHFFEHHDHADHHHHHSNKIPRSLFQLALVGFFTGIIPCPSAVAIFLAAITAEQIPFGVGLVIAFSIGNAITMCTIGILLVRMGKRAFKRGNITFVRSVQFYSSLLILGLGIFVILQTVRQFHIL